MINWSTIRQKIKLPSKEELIKILKKKETWLLITVWVTYFASLFLIVDFLNTYKEVRKSSRIDLAMLEQLSKEEIIQYLKEHQSQRNPLNPCEKVLPVVVTMSIFSASLTAYYLTNRESRLKASVKQILSLLPEEERFVIKMLLENEVVTQYDISQKFGKVKAHRILQKMEERGLIEREDYGKTKLIRLKPEIKKLFQELNREVS